MQTFNFTTILKDAPAGDWIALSNEQDRIVATGKTLAQAVDNAHACGEDEPVVMKVPPVSSLIL